MRERDTVVHAETACPAVARADGRGATRSLSEAVLRALDDVGVRWSFIRGTDGDDVDLLVAPADLPRVAAVMRAQGLVRLRSYGRGTHNFFLGLDQTTGSWVEFDVVTELAFGRYFAFRTRAAPASLAGRRRTPEGWMLSQPDEFWALLLHCLLDKGTFADRHRRRLERLAPAASLDSPLVRALPAAVPCAELLSAVRRAEWSALAAAGPCIARASWRSRPMASAAAYARGAALRVAERPLQAWSRRGSSVALLGPDGSGKSTLAASIQHAFYFPVRRIYMGLWSTRDAPRGPIQTALAIARRPFVVWRRYLTGVGHRALGRLVVYDRYVYDALLPPRGALQWLKRPYFRMLSRCCPAPSLVILLDAPGEVMHARSGEYDPAHLEAERAHFARITNRAPHVVRVDANRPPEAVLNDAVRHIWRHYADRTHR
jgi:thymidylate kinase